LTEFENNIALLMRRLAKTFGEQEKESDFAECLLCMAKKLNKQFKTVNDVVTIV